jgi:hypothetical protein
MVTSVDPRSYTRDDGFLQYLIMEDIHMHCILANLILFCRIEQDFTSIL